ncbi:hypothetical protein CON36_35400 [Bacillus cereus]|uniref:Uncharacterized protein n=2 Tax=Bacillus cereus group TaxID=86661 RepID=A0A9X6WH12_BACTU|nr:MULTISPECIES: hypothetical protein [Bacillus cereus group]PDZ94130.1 hypothetical protein CON36_35400 [Bacillus cereus]PFJ25586.1 hypothetical protein COJ15_35600 [Bacillus thuringiensis]
MRNDDKNIFSINDKEKVEKFLEDKRKQEKEVEETLRKNTETVVENAKQAIQKGINNIEK